MSAWTIIIIVILSGLAGAMAAWLFLRQSYNLKYIDDQIEIINASRLKKLLEEEQKKHEREKQAKEELAQDLIKLNSWYNQQKNHLQKEARDEYKKLVGDPATLDAKVDALIKSNS